MSAVPATTELDHDAVALRSALAAHGAARLVYIAQYGPDGLIKIGSSQNIRQRLRAIQANCPLRLQLLGWRHGGASAETDLHKRFADDRAWDEWFRPTPALLQYALTECEHDEPPTTKYPSEAAAAYWRSRVRTP